MGVKTFVKSAGTNTKFFREAMKEYQSLNFITSGRFPLFFGRPGPMPTCVVLDEIHERCLLNDYAIHTLIMTNIQLVIQGKKPIRLMLASATGWQAILSFLRLEYDLPTVQDGVHDFVPVDIVEEIHPITDHYIPYKHGTQKNAITHQDIYSEVMHLLKFSSSEAGDTQPNNVWCNRPKMTFELGAITLCFIPGHEPGDNLATEVTKQAFTAELDEGGDDAMQFLMLMA